MALALTRAPGREPVVFGYALETLLSAAAPLTELTQKALERQGIFALRPLHTAYPCAVWPQSIQLLAATTLPQLSREEAEYELGLRFGQAFIQARLGTALQDFAQVVGPEKMLLRLARSLRSINNFLDASVTPTGDDGGWELSLYPVREFLDHPRRRADPPHFMRGLLTFAFQHSGAPTARVTLTRHDDARAVTTFHVGL
ncbi:DUF2378 family protein [Myxococcus sp. MISCRS1]|uniref:DUF2378 family protein n=1 Tax=Myxococcus sp. MISCRS1 TaxID=2996786 RepID=UPI00226DEDD2|nr:DUF2378 family protein [Myxococcus sp. MISCRS1]MCY0999399.1 DUF2378 family protein [Myxococcus sp. MISCRS1]